jgi:hypothetical protein
MKEIREKLILLFDDINKYYNHFNRDLSLNDFEKGCFDDISIERFFEQIFKDREFNVKVSKQYLVRILSDYDLELDDLNRYKKELKRIKNEEDERIKIEDQEKLEKIRLESIQRKRKNIIYFSLFITVAVALGLYVDRYNKEKAIERVRIAEEKENRILSQKNEEFKSPLVKIELEEQVEREKREAEKKVRTPIESERKTIESGDKRNKDITDAQEKWRQKLSEYTSRIDNIEINKIYITKGGYLSELRISIPCLPLEGLRKTLHISFYDKRFKDQEYNMLEMCGSDVVVARRLGYEEIQAIQESSNIGDVIKSISININGIYKIDGEKFSDFSSNKEFFPENYPPLNVSSRLKESIKLNLSIPKEWIE